MVRLTRTPAPDSWVNLLADLEIWQRGAGLSEATIRTRDTILRRFARESGLAPATVTSDDLLHWMGAQSREPETRYSWRQAFRIAFQLWNEHGDLDDDPARRLPKIRRPKVAINPVPDDVICAVLVVAKYRGTLIIRLGAEHGLRRGEIARVRGTDLIRTELGWVLRVVKGKGGQQRLIPIRDDEVELVAALQKTGDDYLFPGKIDGHISPGQVGKLVNALIPPPWSMHKLRTRFATTAYTKSKDVLAVKYLMGHENLETTMRYIFIGDQTLRDVCATAVVGPEIAYPIDTSLPRHPLATVLDEPDTATECCAKRILAVLTRRGAVAHSALRGEVGRAYRAVLDTTLELLERAGEIAVEHFQYCGQPGTRYSLAKTPVLAGIGGV